LTRAHPLKCIIIGGGPGGLMAAETLAKEGVSVVVYDRKAALGRKFLLAGRGGLNITHSENFETFITRYGDAADWLRPMIEEFPPDSLRAWCEGLGEPTFVGSSGRVFPKSFKAAPLLRAWKKRLDDLGVTFVMRREWAGWDDKGHLIFATPEGNIESVQADKTILALGGGSWAKLGSDGGWVEILEKQGVAIAPLRPANCGFAVPWSDIFRERFAGQPLKSIIATFNDQKIQGEAMIVDKGVEGGLIYALSSKLRDAIAANGQAVLTLDLRPSLSVEELARRLNTPRGRESLSNHLRKTAGLSPVALGLLREVIGMEKFPTLSMDDMAQAIKALSLILHAPFAIDRAISSAGGIKRDALDDNLMIKALPNVYAIGEMLDWEAPTGGYLLQATFSTGVWAAKKIVGQTQATGG
jgi:uncharacterized flavoprotein (TIGR03862 family)